MLPAWRPTNRSKQLSVACYCLWMCVRHVDAVMAFAHVLQQGLHVFYNPSCFNTHDRAVCILSKSRHAAPLILFDAMIVLPLLTLVGNMFHQGTNSFSRDSQNYFPPLSSTQVTATANATASATVQVAHSASVGHPSVNERLRTAETRLSHLEAYVSRLSSRLRGVEQQQALMGGLITIYFGLKVVRFLMAALFKQIVRLCSTGSSARQFVVFRRCECSGSCLYYC